MHAELSCPAAKARFMGAAKRHPIEALLFVQLDPSLHYFQPQTTQQSRFVMKNTKKARKRLVSDLATNRRRDGSLLSREEAQRLVDSCSTVSMKGPGQWTIVHPDGTQPYPSAGALVAAHFQGQGQGKPHTSLPLSCQTGVF